jgi:hypothetical protein
MLPSPSPSQPMQSRYLSLQWMLANSIGAGVGIGLPLLIADQLENQPHRILGAIAFVTFGIWLGLGQWIMLRKALPIPGLWILAVGFSSVISVGLVSPFFAIARPLVFLIFVIYPLLISVTQWWMFRKMVQPCWGWMIVSFLGGIVGVQTRAISRHDSDNRRP